LGQFGLSLDAVTLGSELCLQHGQVGQGRLPNSPRRGKSGDLPGWLKRDIELDCLWTAS
jgi:hypothetical protein